MKLTQLVEAVIKIPENLYTEIGSFALSVYFSEILKVLDESQHSALEEIAKDIDEFDINLFEDNRKTHSKRFKYSAADVDPRYVTKDARSKQIMVYIGYFGEDYSDAVTFHEKFVSNKIYLNLSSFLPKTFISSVKYNVTASKDHIPYLLSTIRHELQHIIQFDFLSKKNKTMAADVSTTELESDEYAMHPVEFHPSIETARGLFNTIVKTHNRQAESPLTRSQLVDLLKLMVDPTHESDLKIYYKGVLGNAYYSDWYPIPLINFVTMYNKDKKLWRKAVSQLTKLLHL